MKLFTRLLFCAALFMVLQLPAQDIHFSMFYASPLTLNPAMTGAFDGTYRAAAIYRNQYRSISTPFVTSGASFDIKLLADKLKGDIFSVGGLLTNDKSGDGRLEMTTGMASIAYHKGLDKQHHHYLGLGIQMGYVNKSLQFLQLTYPNEYSTDIQNFNTSNYNDNITKSNIGYFDMNVGIMEQSKINDMLSIMAGVAMFHIVPPRESFLGEDVILAPRYTGHIGLRIKASNHIYVTPNFIYQYQNAAQEFNFGSAVEYHFAAPKSGAMVSVGGWYRLNDAAIISVGGEYYHVRLMFAYDVNASPLDVATNGRGAFEMAVIFTGLIKTREVVYPVLVPCPMM